MTRPDPFHFYGNRHDHRSCIDAALEKARTICRQNNTRFTPLRQRVFELIWSDHKPVLAYDLLKTLRNEKYNAEPPTVYRALDFLLQHGLVHKIQSLKAYVGCGFPERCHINQFLICNQCNRFVELDESSIEQAISDQADQIGFEIAHRTIEILGLCPNCRSGPPQDRPS